MAQVELEISLEEKQVLKALTALTKETESFGKAAQKGFGTAEIAFGSFVGSLAAQAVVGSFNVITDAAKGLFNTIINDGVKAAIEQEDALNRLNVSLALAGNFSDDASRSLQEFAAEIQRTTKFEDDAVVSNIALLESLTRLDAEGLKKATTAAVDLAAALGIDLDTATNLVAKSASGNVAAFARYGIEIQKGTTDTETFSNTLETLNKRFGGSAAAQVNTFSGATSQLGNTFGDLLESVGQVITQNPVVINLFKIFIGVLEQAEGFIKANQQALKDLVANGIIFLAESINAANRSIRNFITAIEENKDVLLSIGAAYLAVNAGILLYSSSTTAAAAVTAAFTTGLGVLKAALISTGVGALVVGLGLVINAMVKASEEGIKFGDAFKQSIGGLLSVGIPAIELFLNATGALVGVFNKDLGESIKKSINALKEYQVELSNSGKTEQQVAEEKRRALQQEPQDLINVQNLKQQIRKQETANVVAAKEEEFNALRELEAIRREELSQTDVLLKEQRIAEDDEEFQRLQANLGRDEAARQIAEAQRLANEGKHQEARNKLRKANDDAAKKDIQSLFDFEKNTNAGRAANLQATLANIATLQSQSNAELFAIGKAAAIATATIDGIAAVQKALASTGPPLNFILAAVVGTAAALNIGKIASAKPPSRQTGGLVPGPASSTDNTLINAAGGELVLNRRQQTDLFNSINQGRIGGNSSGGVVVNIQGNVIADDDSQVQKLIERINDVVEFRNSTLRTS